MRGNAFSFISFFLSLFFITNCVLYFYTDGPVNIMAVSRSPKVGLPISEKLGVRHSASESAKLGVRMSNSQQSEKLGVRKSDYQYQKNCGLCLGVRKSDSQYEEN